MTEQYQTLWQCHVQDSSLWKAGTSFDGLLQTLPAEVGRHISGSHVPCCMMLSYLSNPSSNPCMQATSSVQETVSQASKGVSLLAGK